MKPLIKAAVQVVHEQVMDGGRKAIVAKRLHRCLTPAVGNAPSKGTFGVRLFERPQVSRLHRKTLRHGIRAQIPVQ